MFDAFFFKLRDQGLPVNPAAFMKLQQGLAEGLIASLDDLYVVARALLVKRERHLDLYDRVFAAHFEGRDLEQGVVTLEHDLERILRSWLEDPEYLASMTEAERSAVEGLGPEELVEYFLRRLAEQTERHEGGSRWIGTGGTSPAGHGGHHPGGMRVGGRPGGSSAIKAALARRFIDYSDETPLSAGQLGEALRALRDLRATGPRDELNVEETIRETTRLAGEIELVFDRRLRDRLEVKLFIDNGGWSMLPHASRTQALFANARDVFARLDTHFFHNCIYDTVWSDPKRLYQPVALDDVLRAPASTRVIIVGDASMAPWELVSRHGAIDVSYQQRRSGIECLQQIAERFPHSVWINPIQHSFWRRSAGATTIHEIRKVFPMVDLTLTGIEEAVELLRN